MSPHHSPLPTTDLFVHLSVINSFDEAASVESNLMVELRKG